MGRTFKTPPRALLMLAATFCLSLTSCLPTGNDCATDFDVAVKPDDIQGSTKILIGLAKLAFLEDSAFVLEDVELETGVRGAHTRGEDISLDMNGIKMSRKDGQPMCDQMDREGADSRGRFKVHKMFLNGGLSFELFLMQLKLQRGTLAMNVKGKNLPLKDAVVHFKGKKYGKCPTKPPEPPKPDPKPVAKTKIDSAEPAASPTASANATFKFSADQTGVTFWCSIDGLPAAKCASPQSYAGLASGTHLFKVYSQNSSGVNEDPPAQYQWTVDRVAPTVTITNAASLPTLTNQGVVSFAFAMSKSGHFECSLDAATFKTCVSPLALNGLGEGPHHFEVRAIDDLGNVSGSPAAFDWNVDQTAPIATIVSVTPAAPISNVTSRRFEFAANESSNFECSVDNGSFAPCVSPVALSDLLDGPHYFEVRAVDLAGNRGVSSSAAWKNDTVAPRLTLGNVAPAAGTVSRADLVSVEVSADETATLSCSFDGAAAVCPSPLQYAGLGEGAHGLRLFATDAAGNVSSTLELGWTLDRTAPTLSFAEISPSAASALNVRDVSFRVAVDEDARLVFTLNGQVVPSGNPLALTGLNDGAYHLEVSAVDAAGNASGRLVHDFLVDSVAPSVMVIANDTRNPTNADRREFTFSASEDVTYACDVDLAGFGPCVTPFTLSGLADGDHAMNVRATDLAGNAGVVAVAWTVDTRAPVTQLAVTVQGSNATLNFNADESALFYCVIDGGAERVCASPLALSGLAAGAHVVKVFAEDVAGNRDLAGVTQNFSGLAPIVTSITSANPTAGSLTAQNSATFAFAADQAASGFECSLDGAVYVACASPVSYNALADGAHAFRVRAIDAFGARDQVGASSAWTVDQTAPVAGNLSASVTTNSITVTWTTDEGATDQVRYGVGFAVTTATAEGQAFATSHSIRLVGLSSNTTYTIQVFGRDRAGNTYSSATRTVKTSR